MVVDFRSSAAQSLQGLHTFRIQRWTGNIMADPSHPGQKLFETLPSSNVWGLTRPEPHITKTVSSQLQLASSRRPGTPLIQTLSPFPRDITHYQHNHPQQHILHIYLHIFTFFYCKYTPFLNNICYMMYVETTSFMRICTDLLWVNVYILLHFWLYLTTYCFAQLFWTFQEEHIPAKVEFSASDLPLISKDCRSFTGFTVASTSTFSTLKEKVWVCISLQLQ